MPDEIIRREFPAELVPTGDGRTLDLRIVPHGVTARVSDDGGRTFYEEEWVRGVFRNRENKPKNVLVNVEHERGFGGVVGRGVGFNDLADGFDGEFRILNGPDGDKALELVNEGVYTGVSVEAVPIKSERTKDGLVRRLSAKLLNVSLCRNPAFPDARVLAVRESPHVTVNFGGALTSSSAEELQAKWIEATAEREQPEPEEPAPDEPTPDEPEPVSPQMVREEMAAEELAKNPPEFSDAELALQRVGYEPLLIRAVTRKPWDGSASRFSDEQYQRSCLIDRGGDMPVKERCSLPVLEPSGDVNSNALGAAAAALAGARGGLRGVTPEQKATAARKLLRYYRMADMDPPPALVAMAGR